MAPPTAEGAGGSIGGGGGGSEAFGAEASALSAAAAVRGRSDSGKYSRGVPVTMATGVYRQESRRNTGGGGYLLGAPEPRIESNRSSSSGGYIGAPCRQRVASSDAGVGARARARHGAGARAGAAVFSTFYIKRDRSRSRWERFIRSRRRSRRLSRTGFPCFAFVEVHTGRCNRDIDWRGLRVSTIM